MIVLGISVGTTRSGVCVLKDAQLLDRHIHSYPSAWTDGKPRLIINSYRRYFERYNIEAVMLKVTPPHKHSSATKRLIRRIEALAKEYGCKFDLITKSEIKDRLLLKSTKQIIDYAMQLYPELSALHEKGKPSDHSYFKKMYEAVLSAHIFQERLKGKQNAH